MKYNKPLREPYNKRLQERHELSDVEYGKLRISKSVKKEIFQGLNNEEYKLEWTVENGKHTVKIIEKKLVEGQLALEEETKETWSYEE